MIVQNVKKIERTNFCTLCQRHVNKQQTVQLKVLIIMYTEIPQLQYLAISICRKI